MYVVYNTKGVDQMTSDALAEIIESGVRSDSRVGPVLRASDPVTFVTDLPEVSMWSTCPIRDANPLFHMREALWILEGGQSCKELVEFNARYSEYAQPDGLIHGAYGHRFRHAFGFDQIERVIELLKNDPLSRQAVLTMWAPGADLRKFDHVIKDRPCNTQVYVDITERGLNIMVTQRSGDLFWGTLGANHVCFRILQEYLAYRLGCGVGIYTHVVFNLHVYQSVVDKYIGMLDNRYSQQIRPSDISTMDTLHLNDESELSRTLRSKVILKTAYEMHKLGKADDTKAAIDYLGERLEVSDDFYVASMLWLTRRLVSRNKKENSDEL